jgi:hypothetical protein
MFTFQKINQTPTSSFSYEEKAETDSISTLDSEYSLRNSSHNCHQYIAISPDGTQIITLNTETYQLKLCKFNDFATLKTIKYNGITHIDAQVNWSLAVSNEFTFADGSVDVLVAVSRFVDDDVKYKNRSREQLLGVEVIKHFKASTWIISVTQESRISSSINNMGGVVKFLDNKGELSTEIVLTNTHGINKFHIKHERIRDIIHCKGENDTSWFRLFFSDKTIEQFHFPTKFLMKRLSDDETCNLLIQQSLVKGRFVVENYKNKVQTVEMYNLKTNLLENTFQKCEESATSVVGKGSPCFAISNNELLFAYCRGTNSITIYLMENGLEVTTKKFKGRNFYRILFFDFIQDDNKLFIVIEEVRYNEDTENDVTTVIVIWDLFSSSDNDCVRRINSFFPARCEHPQKLANASGNIFTITEDGNIISILKEPEIANLLNSENDNTRNKILLNYYTAIYSSLPENYHLVYSLHGEYLDSLSKNSKGVIVRNPEPWINSKYYRRISAYLDDNKSIQLIIGESTVQVWREKKNGLSSKKVLEYIWTNNCTEKSRQMQIRSLEVGYKEFSLTLYIPSGNSPFPQFGDEIKLEWPEEVNNPVYACRALEFLDKKKNEPSDPKKQRQFEELIQQTECIVKKYLNKKCGLWRMLDIRFNIMANLIRGNCISIIKSILSAKSDYGKNKHLHIPRCYSWYGKIKKTDLEIAIECTERGYRKDTILVRYLLDYYSDNAVGDSNWMFTVSKAIPLLYEYQLGFYVKELFQKPCFGTNEVYFEQSNNCDKDIIKSDHRNVRALNVNTDLIKRNECNLCDFLRKLIPQRKQR